MHQNPPTLNPLGRLVEERRLDRNLSLRDLATTSSVALSTLHRNINSGGWKLEDLARVAKALDTTPAALLAEIEDAA